MGLIELYASMFFAFLKIGMFGFGGGYAMLPLIQHEVVYRYGWIALEEFTDLVAIFQTTPGAIALNSATYIGYSAVTTAGYGTLEGILGSVICTAGVSIPPLIIMTLVCTFFFKIKHNSWIQAALKGLKPAIIGLIASAALILMNQRNFPDYTSWGIFLVIFIASLKKVDPILLILIAGVAGVLLY
ncbi:MAG TPA: chromate transporter [Porphyromonadaceae bacterium]|jgi:chromate transporter|nr:chromate transporter [Porphyromonadaceae bacterium]HBL32941.1 chromate transporter [Porphyromonadaceae bacterium]HBX20074.1 chromate transporter [Porphyromonadaceae bacterium]HCM20524.1 chromate transporter [Porphyromonadaceae bacterium]